MKIWKVAFVALMALECIPFWAFRYFPSQDGPSHLYNAAVVVHYQAEPIFREYFRLTPWQPAGNLLTQFILVGLLKLASPGVAEKLLLTGYVVLLFLCLRYFFGALTQYVDHFAVFAGILAPNAFLYLGFWNFCYSIGLLLLTVGYYARHKQQWTARPLALLGVLGFVLYLTHVVSWVICVAAAPLLELPIVLAVFFGPERPRTKSIRGAIGQAVLPLCSLLPPGIFLLVHLARSRAESSNVPSESLRSLLWDVYSLSFLRTLPLPGMAFSKAVAAVLLCCLFCVVITNVRRRRHEWPSTGLLAISLTCAVLAIAGPDHVGTGLYIHSRVAMYAWLFFLAWLAAQSWPRLALHCMSSLFVTLAIIALVASFPSYAWWSQELSEFVSMGQNIRPRSTVLPLDVERLPPGTTDPNRHAVDLLSAASIIDLGDYEALTDYFSTEYRADRSPIPALGTLPQLEAVPGQVNIARYERETGTQVSYIFVQGSPASTTPDGKRPEQKLYAGQLSAYKLIASGKSGAARLYQRIAAWNAP